MPLRRGRGRRRPPIRRTEIGGIPCECKVTIETRSETILSDVAPKDRASEIEDLIRERAAASRTSQAPA